MFWKKKDKRGKPESVIEKTLQNIHGDLKKIKLDFPPLSEIDKAKIEVLHPDYPVFHIKFLYEKGKRLDAPGIPDEEGRIRLSYAPWRVEDIFEKDGSEISVSVTYPIPEGQPPDKPSFVAKINGKVLTGMVFVYANSQNNESFQKKVGEIIYSRLKEMEKQLNAEFNFYGSEFFKIPAEQYYLDEKQFLTVENFKLIKNYILENGTQLSGFEKLPIITVCIEGKNVELEQSGSEPPVITVCIKEKNLKLEYMKSSEKIKISQIKATENFIPYSIYYVKKNKIGWDYAVMNRRRLPRDMFIEHFHMVVEFMNQKIKGAKEMGQTKKLGIAISSDKESYNIGDTVKLKIVLKNTGIEEFYLLPWGSPFSTGWVKASDGGKLEGLALINVPPPFANKSDFRILKPGGEYKKGIEGKIERTEMENAGKGFFLNFRDSAISLKNTEKFKIYAEYENEINKFVENLKVKPIQAWTGRINSKPISIEIKAGQPMRDDRKMRDMRKTGETNHTGAIRRKIWGDKMITAKKVIEIAKQELSKHGYRSLIMRSVSMQRRLTQSNGWCGVGEVGRFRFRVETTSYVSIRRPGNLSSWRTNEPMVYLCQVWIDAVSGKVLKKLAAS